MEFNKEEFKANLSARLRRQYGKDISQANKHDLFDAVSASAMEIIMPNWMATRDEYEKKLLSIMMVNCHLTLNHIFL